MATHPLSLRVLLCRWAPLLLLALAGAAANAQVDPPARVATLTHIDGSVVFAPMGETEWADASINRPITRGDRLWTDKGARAELHLGSAVLHIDSQTFLDVVVVDDEVLQASLNEGTVSARVRQLEGGENFEIDTPQLAFRATQPGDYRIDVDPERGTTRVTIRSGAAVVYGAGGGTLQLQPGQRIGFSGRDLTQVALPASPLTDGFDRWAGERNAAEDQSISARYVPREVVGYQQLDAHGVWAQDPSYGAVWYPRITIADWAPYRYGRWDWINPWGWTWIDDAPWGFAPSHYGRWAQIGPRWAWVPGRIGPRPVYAPALVSFVGGGLSIGSGPGIGWFPLAPGEAWRPSYRASPVYLRNVNRFHGGNPAAGGGYFHQRRPDAVTAVRVDDFHRRQVNRHWNRVNPVDLARSQDVAPPAMPDTRSWRDASRGLQPRTQLPTPAIVSAPQPQFVAPRIEQRRGDRTPERDQAGERERRARGDDARVQDERRQRFQNDEQRRQQQVQQMQRQQERAQHEHALRQQQAIQHQQAMQERAQRQQQRMAPQQELHPRRAMPAQPQPQAVQPPPRERGERGWGRAHPRDERSSEQAGDERERGRGHGRGGRFN